MINQAIKTKYHNLGVDGVRSHKRCALLLPKEMDKPEIVLEALSQLPESKTLILTERPIDWVGYSLPMSVRANIHSDHDALLVNWNELQEFNLDQAYVLNEDWQTIVIDGFSLIDPQMFRWLEEKDPDRLIFLSESISNAQYAIKLLDSPWLEQCLYMSDEDYYLLDHFPGNRYDGVRFDYITTEPTMLRRLEVLERLVKAHRGIIIYCLNEAQKETITKYMDARGYKKGRDYLLSIEPIAAECKTQHIVFTDLPDSPDDWWDAINAPIAEHKIVHQLLFQKPRSLPIRYLYDRQAA